MSEKRIKVKIVGNGELKKEKVNKLLSHPSVESSDYIDVVVDSGITSIGEYAFQYCQKIRSVLLPEGLEIVDEGAFDGCKNLNEVKLPSSIKEIRTAAFSNCDGLLDINLPEGLIHIGDWAFNCCQSVRDLYIPENIKSIGVCAFENCSRVWLESYDNCLYIGSRNNPFFALAKTENIYIVHANVHKNTKFILPGAFSGRNYLKSVTIPEGVRYIGDGAFEESNGITEIYIPKTVEYVGDWAFDNTNITIYCGAEKEPSEWGPEWNGDKWCDDDDYKERLVIWGSEPR